VAVIDTGMYISHRDPRDNIWTNPEEMPGTGIDDDNKYADDVHGWDFYHDDASVFDNANQDAGRCPPWYLLSHTGSSIRSILRIVEHSRGRVRAASATEIFRRSSLRVLNVGPSFRFSAIHDLLHPLSEEAVQILRYGVGLVSLVLSRFYPLLKPGRADAEPFALRGLLREPDQKHATEVGPLLLSWLLYTIPRGHGCLQPHHPSPLGIH